MPILNMIYGLGTSSAPQWTPGVNTIVYLPLRGDLTDEAGTYTWTSGANLTFDSTLANMPVAYMTYDNGYAYTTTTAPAIDGSNSYTISGWVKQTSGQGAMCLIDTGFNNLTSPNDFNGMGYYRFYDGRYKGYFVIYLGGSSSSKSVEVAYNYNPGTDWHLWTCTYAPGSQAIYLDGVQVSTGTKTLTGSSNPSKHIEIGRDNYGNNRSPEAYYSDIIFESKAWTAQEVSDYYNTYKANYGIS